MWYIAALMVVFWGMQCITVLLLKYGSTAPPRFVPGFIVGNTVGVASTWLWMLMVRDKYGTATIMGLATGGAFLFGQIVLAIVFRGHFNWLHSVGVGAVVAGMLCLCFAEGLKPAGEAATGQQADARAPTVNLASALHVTEAATASPPAPAADAPWPPQAAAPAVAPRAPGGARPAPAPPP